MKDIIVKEIKVKNVLTKSNLPVSDYSVNPYVGCQHGCKYCYASFMKRFTNHSEPWGSFVDVKYWEPIKNPKKYVGKEMFFGSVTDPYQPLEEKYERTRNLLKELQGSGCKVSIATKSDLVLRDLDLIKTFPEARVSFSINTLDEEFRTEMDDSVSIERKIKAMKILHEANIRTTCFISPIFPGITDVEAIIRKCKNICNLIWLENLNLRGDYKEVIMKYIKEKHPDLLPLYEEIYRKILKLSAFVVFPLMIGLAAVAKPFVNIILGSQWEFCGQLLQIICFAMMWYPIHAINLNLLQVKGRSDLFLRLEIIKKILGISVLCITAPLGLIYMCYGQIFNSLVALVINTYYTGKLIKVGFLKQIRDLLPTIVLSLTMFAAIWTMNRFLESNNLQLIIGIIVGVIIYFFGSYFFRFAELKLLFSLIKRK